MKKAAILVVCALAIAPAWAINKCTDAGGKVVYQDAACKGKGGEITVRPASGRAVAPVATPATVGADAAPAVKASKEGVFGASWQRRTYLENRGVADARGALQSQLARCDAQQAELAARKGSANNNLAGATFLQSLSTEMQAAATACDSKTRDLRSQLDSVERELRELQAKK